MNLRRYLDPNRVSVILIWVILVLLFPLILLADLYVTPWKIPSTIIYAIPIMVAGRILGKVAAAIVLPLALAFEVLDGFLERADTATIALSGLALVLVGFLTLVWTEAERRSASLAAERSSLYERERSRSQELEESRQRLLDFFSIVSHDLLNQTTTLVGVGSMLSRWDSLAAADRKQLGGAFTSASKIVMRLANDLLDASRIGSGRLEIIKMRCDMVDLVRAAVERRQPISSKHRLIVEARSERIEGIWDQERMSQALGNLIDNAVKYSPQGGEIRAIVEPVEGCVKVAVSDQGVGIAPEDIHLIFQPYSRLHRSSAISGTGLGLYIVKGIVEAHCGSIRVESELGRGSTFTIEMPLLEGTAPGPS